MAEQDVDGSATAASVGVHLRQAREARGESVEEVSHVLKLRPRQIEAIEAGRFDLLPGRAFVRGFVRNYSRYLGVDVEPMMGALSVQSGADRVDLAPVTNAQGVMPAGRDSTGLVKGLFVVILAGVIVLGAGWHFDWFRVAPGEGPQKASSDENATYQAPVDLQEVESVGDDVAGTSEPVELLPGEPSSVASVPLIEPLAVLDGDESAQSGLEESDEAGAAENESAAAESADMLVLRTEAEAWIEVRDVDGTVLHIGTEPAGSTLELEGESPFSLVIGNAASVSLTYRGEPIDLSPHTRSSGVARLEVE